MRLSLDKTKQFYAPGDPDGAYIIVRALSLEEIAEAESDSTELRVDNFDNASMSLDPYKKANAIAKKCLVEWGGFLEANGNPIPFSKKNDKKMAGFAMKAEARMVRFFEWVEHCHNELQAEIQEEAERAEEN